MRAALLRERREWLRLASDTARSAAAQLQRPGGRAVLRSTRRDVKIAADRRLDAHVIQRLGRGSAWPILTEESGLVAAGDSEYRWIVDPLDGSMNYSRGLPFCAVSIALWRADTPVLGVVHDPNRDESFTGIVGAGAWLNGRRVATSAVTRLSEAVLCTGFPAGTSFTTPAIGTFVANVRRFRKIRLIGTAALSLAYVACGRADAYHERDIRIWDVAAGLALVRAAGGRVRVAPGRESTARHVLATNGRLSAAYLRD